MTALLRTIVRDSTQRFIAFVDSRKQTEQLASILSRQSGEETDELTDDTDVFKEILKIESVLPYRAGIEESDRRTIEARLTNGDLRGVISTSALELGIDIRGLDIAILVGVPRSSTSLQQRIGRIGRNRPGHVYVLNSGTVYDEAVFRNPTELLNRPPAESALYLLNPRIQYVHALCLARPNGEHDQLAGGVVDAAFSSPVTWPDGFLDLCYKERSGQISAEFQSMKAESGDNPNYAFPLRDVERQFQVEMRLGPAKQACGTLSHSQLMREAYPGAVYYHAMQAYRVTSVQNSQRLVLVRKEKRYSTNPSKLPIRLYPNLLPGNIFRALKYGSVRLIESNVQVAETVVGFKERRGRTEQSFPYPTDNAIPGVRFSSAKFSRNYFTTGVLLFAPSLAALNSDAETLGSFLFEALLMTAPFERQDIGFSAGKMSVATSVADKDSRYVALFDQTYGSLRLSGRLLEPGVFGSVMRRALELITNDDSGLTDASVVAAARNILDESKDVPVEMATDISEPVGGAASKARIVMPGSFGLNTGNGNAEFMVARVFVNPRMGCLAYAGRHASARDVNQIETIRADALVSVPGESVEGFYDYDTGEVCAD